MRDASRKLLWFPALVALYFCASSLNVAIAQSLIPLPVDDALNVRKFAEWMPISPSPDGQWLSYTVRDNRRSKPMEFEAYLRTGVPAWISGSGIFLTNMSTGETRSLTDGKGETGFRHGRLMVATLRFCRTRTAAEGHASGFGMWRRTK